MSPSLDCKFHDRKGTFCVIHSYIPEHRRTWNIVTALCLMNVSKKLHTILVHLIGYLVYCFKSDIVTQHAKTASCTQLMSIDVMKQSQYMIKLRK